MLHGKQVKDTSLSLVKIDPTTGQLLTLAGTTKIQQNAIPTLGIDLVNKDYVDSVASGLDVKKSVRAATTTSLVIASASNVVDGVTLTSGDRILVKDQSIASENGIYIFNGTGNALTRSTDADEDYEVTAGLFTFVEEGLFLQETGWVLATNNPITLSSSYLTFSQFSSNGVVSASNGLTKTINDIKLGGVLTQNTVITGSNNSLYIGDLSTFTIDSTNVAINANGGDSDIYSSNSLNLTGDISTNLISNQTNINLYASTQSVANNGNNNTIIVSDGLANKGIVYASDYSSNFTPESLVSKRYVDSSVSSGVSASNGLTKDGINIELGGSLTKNTYINGAFDLNIGLSTSLSKFYTQVSDNINTSIIDQQSGGLELSNTDGTTSSNVRLFTTDAEFSTTGITGSNSLHLYSDGQTVTNNGTENTMIIVDDITLKGLVYQSDYSANFSPESLVSKRYVDNTTTSLTSSVSNGLTYSNGSIKLGGNLIENTNIDGAFDLRIGNNNPVNILDVIAGNTASVTTRIYTDGSQSALRTDDVSGEYNIILAEGGNGVNLVSSDINGVSASAFYITNGSGAVVNNGSNNTITIDDGISKKGIVYVSDYSANFTPESLVSKRYVDNTISSNNLTYSNGLTKVGGNVLLGGTISQNTNIAGAGNELYFGTGVSTLYTLGVNSDFFNVYGNSGINMSGASIAITGLSDLLLLTPNKSIRLYETPITVGNNGTNNGLIVYDDVTKKGLVYNDDYSSNFTPESLVSKRYVDSRIQTGVSASNGLYENGNYVQLGGTLSQNTNITGYGYTFSLDADTVLLTSTSSTNVMAMLEVDAVQSGWIRSDVTDGTNSSIHLMSLTQHVMLIDDSVNSSTITAVTNSISLVTDNGTNNSSLYIYNTPQTITNNGSNNNSIITDQISSKGLVYATDYSANFTPESLVSKRYVDTQSGGILTLDNKSMTASVTTASGQQISGAITTTPKNDSYVSVYINGLKMKLGNGVTTYDVYFADSGSLGTPRTITNIQAGDVLVRGSGLGYDTDATDFVDYDFQF